MSKSRHNTNESNRASVKRISEKKSMVSKQIEGNVLSPKNKKETVSKTSSVNAFVRKSTMSFKNEIIEKKEKI